MNTATLDPLPESAWNQRTARHLLSRAGFGIPEGRVQTLCAQGLPESVSELVDYESILDSLPAPDVIIEPMSPSARKEALLGLTEDERRKKTSEWRQAERHAVQAMKAWWIERMAATARPLEEKMTLFWHGHFATSAQKVQSSYHTFQLNDVFRKHASGNLKALTIAVGQSPSMLRYLDNTRSTKGKPNENWARELMELFTMGVGTYSEEDIKHAARAFTGWSADHRQFQYRERAHDFGPKRFLGREGEFDGWDIVDIIFEQPVTAEFICGKLWKFFAYEHPEPEVVSSLAAAMRAHSYALKPVLRQMFMSQAFYSERAMGSQIKSPAQYVVQLAHDLNLTPSPYALMARATAQLGQDLFYPPNVKGWDGNRAWINANSLLIRYNLPVALAAATGAGEPAMDAMDDPAMMMLIDQGGEGAMRKRVQEALATLRPERRRAMRQRLQAATPEERLAIAREILGEQFASPGGWSPRAMVAELPCESGAQFVDALVARFVPVGMSAHQKALLLTAIGLQPDAGVNLESVTDHQLNAGLHLLFSSAEYQLC